MYSLSNLNDKEFEELSNDIVSCLYNVRVERFKAGKDQGIDGRFSSSPDKSTIIQAKHYARSKFSNLYNTILKSELNKVKKLNPKKYILVTSMSLGVEQKSKIHDLLKNYSAVSDILHYDDIVSFLDSNPKILRRYFKLWLSSTNVLQNVLNSDVYLSSKWVLDDTKNKLKLYVKSNNHENVRRALEEYNYVIVTGAPGIGKTTISKCVCLEYYASGYEFINISRNINEAYKVYNEDIPQVFYYDDFLGSNFLDYIENREDSDIAAFIKNIKSSNNKKLILSSRTNIFKKGVHSSLILKKEKVESQSVVDLESYSKLEKAKILYNHLYFSNLTIENIEDVFNDLNYIKIINHRNFNPRLIEFITDIDRQVDKEPYLEFVYRVLNRPVDIWEHVFDYQLSKEDKVLVYFVCLNSKGVYESKIQSMCNKYFDLSGIKVSDNWFDISRKTLVGSMINRTIIGDNIVYELFNPSIRDYFIQYMGDKIDMLSNLIYISNSPQETRNLIIFNRSSFSTSSIKLLYKNVLSRIIKSDQCRFYNDLYLALYSLGSHKISWSKEYQRNALEIIKSASYSDQWVGEAIDILIDFSNAGLDLDYNLIIGSIIGKCDLISDLESLSSLMSNLEDVEYEINDINNDSYQELASKIIFDEAHQYIYDEVSTTDDLDRQVKSIVEGLLDKFSYPVDITSSEIIYNIDLEDIIRDLYDDGSYFTSSKSSDVTNNSEIHSLFSKYW